MSLGIDRLAFEALRHRVAAITDEGSTVLKMVSTSPVATEANDCNVAIMDREGAAIAIGQGLSSHAIGCMMTTAHVRSDYSENPGIREGDMFLANDPYTCSAHQTCVALVAPVWWEGEIAAWVGAGIHLPDAGGPVPGQVNLGATSIYQEATPLPPLRIVEQGRIRKDLEAEFTIRSRTPQQLSLDLRALLAACQRLTDRLHEMFERYSPGVIHNLFEDMIAYNRAHLAERLRTIPDGDWDASVWLDFPQGSTIEFYECRLILQKRSDRLHIDLSQSSPQAGAVINSGEPGLISGVLNALMVLLGYGLPKCPEAILQSIEINSRPGTFVHATHPAGCSKATTSACHAILMAFNIAMSKMFDDVEELRLRVLAGTGGFLPVIDIDGIDQRGSGFGAPLLDLSLSAGYGAMMGKDGIDSAGPLHSPGAGIANVETYEARYPLLYLWRRQEMDSGGLGEYRGGRGVGLAWMLHGTKSPMGAVLHGHGCSVASTPGIRGGHPGATNTFSLVRNSGCRDRLAAGELPQYETDFDAPVEPTSGLHMTQLEEGDVVIGRNNGGGGWGDPLSRVPALVLSDVRIGAVSEEWARRGYGVVLDGDTVDERATEKLRDQMRRFRLTQGPRQDDAEVTRGPTATPAVCDHPAETVTNHRKLNELGARILPFAEEQAFRAVEEVCPACGTLLDIRIVVDDAAPQAGVARSIVFR